MTSPGKPTSPIPAFTLGRVPRIHFGAGQADRIPEVVTSHGRRVLVVLGSRSPSRSARRERLLDGLGASGADVVGEVRVDGEPSPDSIDRAVALHRQAEADVVLGVGGGSVLDSAKAIAGLLRTRTGIRDHLEGVGPQLPYPGPAVPFVAVPTTAGTGSEATRNAVVSERGPRGYKRSFRDERLVAQDAVVDPDLLDGASRPLIAANGLDALTQLLESYVSVRASPMTDALAMAGLAAVRDGLTAWHRDPGGHGAPAARSRMAWAALLSGICLAHAGLGAVHGLASPLGAYFPIAHGSACGAVLVATTEVNLAALRAREPGSPALARYAELGRLLAGLPPDATDDAARDALLSWLRTLAGALDVPGLEAFEVTPSDIARIVADSRGSSMRTNPIVLTDDEIGRILRASL